MAESIIAKLQASKRFQVDCGNGLVLDCVRPSQSATTIAFPGGRDDREIIAWVCRHVEGWNATERHLIAEGNGQILTFDRDLLAEWLADHVSELLVVSNQMFRKYDEWVGLRTQHEADAKNSVRGSSAEHSHSSHATQTASS